MHLSAEMWRMLPAFWVIGLLGVGFGWPLMRRRVRPNPYYGVTISETTDRDDVWYPVNAVLGRDLVFLGARIIVLTTVLAYIGWRQPQHYLLLCGAGLVAEAILLAGRWKRIGDAVRKQLDQEKSGDR